ncbi:MAG: M20 family peptidase [Bacteroidia bacterium]|nr:M20 family peptidase [Bacteroidia bacterium]
MKKSLLAILIAAILFVGYLLYNAFSYSSTQLQVEPVEKTPIPDGAIERFTESISIKTISYQEEEHFDSIQFQLFNDFLHRSYPQVHEQCEHNIFNGYSHLFRWDGQDANLQPIILMAHHDVVPIASLPLWTVHPFEEGVKNDTIYGRGAMDDKCSMISILEAVEQMMNEGYTPKRTIYLAFGHDEELFGPRGALEIARYLEEKGVKAAMVLDEGLARTERMIPNLDKETALIGIAEKGGVSLEMIVNMAGGHSSMPAPETSIDVLSAAVSKVKKNPLEASITPALHGFLDKLGPEMDFKSKLAFSNRSIFKSMILGTLGSSNSTNALIRTTTSPTIFNAGIKENVIPTSSRAVINFRILPGETPDDVLAHVIKVVDDPRVDIKVIGAGRNPSPVSPIDNKAYETLERSIKEIFPNILTSPNLVVGGTDSRHFSSISPNIYRFVPFRITPENQACFHGIDERVPVEEFEDAIRFYRRLIINSNELDLN